MGLLSERRRAMGGKALLYDAEVEYVESSQVSGPISIKTNYIPQGKNVDLYFDFMRTSNKGSTQALFIGAYGGSANSYMMQFGSSNQPKLTWGSASSLYTPLNINLNEKYHLEAHRNEGTYSINDVEGTLGTYLPVNGLETFSINSNDIAGYYRIYSLKVIQDGITALDLIPVRKGNIGYLYDKVSNQLLPNVGVGEFTFGSDIDPDADKFVVKGKFTDDSTESDWVLRINERAVNISSYVNPYTKEFIYESLTKPTSLWGMFQNTLIEYVYSIKGTENVTRFNSMFSDTKNLKSMNLESLSTHKGIFFGGMFQNCKAPYINVDSLYTKDATSFDNMFRQIAADSLDLSSLENDNVSSMTYMFYSSPNLTTIIFGNRFSCKSCKSFEGMLSQSAKLEHLDISMFDTSNATNFSWVFSGDTSLRELKVNWDFRNLTTIASVFANCKSLTTITGSISNLKISISLKDCPLTNESAMLFINGLADVDEPQTITFSKTTYNTLTEDQIKIATDKNWIVASA